MRERLFCRSMEEIREYSLLKGKSKSTISSFIFIKHRLSVDSIYSAVIVFEKLQIRQKIYHLYELFTPFRRNIRPLSTFITIAYYDEHVFHINMRRELLSFRGSASQRPCLLMTRLRG